MQYVQKRIANWAVKNPNASNAGVARYMNGVADDMRKYLQNTSGYINKLF